MTTQPDSHLIDTIAAVATPSGEGGLAVVRVSGCGARRVAERIFRPSAAGPLRDRRVRHGWAIDRRGDALDEVLLLSMFAPRSYTGEDVIEIHCHGGRLVVDRVLALCRDAGARPAEPGEFTRRAFLNGRLSLDQAEAVADLIHAGGELCARAALRQLRGGLADELARIESPLLAQLAELEGGLEFDEAEAMETDRRSLRATIAAAIVELDRLISLGGAGRRLRDGFQVVLVGAPNAGKSALFNALLGRDRALVDDQAGTTRDFLVEPLHRDGLVFNLHDTAGLREKPERMERMGIERTLELAASADILLVLNPADRPITDPGLEPVSGRIDMRVTTKGDLGPETDAGGLVTSALSGDGIEALAGALVSVARTSHIEEAARLGTLLNERHLFRLQRARRGLADLKDAIEEQQAGDEVVATLLSGLLAELGEISGRTYTESLLDEVFKRFCVGK